jgi:hypothetical protein
MLDSIAKLLIAAGALTASPVGPDANVDNYSINEWDPSKGLWEVNWTNGDPTAYIHVSEDQGATVARTLFPGTTSYQGSEGGYSNDDVSNQVRIRATKSGINLAYIGFA